MINGEKTQVHMCEHCAKGNSDLFMFSGNSGFSLNNLLTGLLNMESNIAKTEGHNKVFQANDTPQCSQCHMTLQQFKKVGRFGCSNCYHTFKEYISPILRRVHGGNTVHAGKIPKRIGGDIHIRKQLENLKSKINEYIIQEEFEKAAEIRDEIKSLEKKLSNKEGS
ncbi:protein arginine kinase activator [Metabacillus malikii]|uniref:Protein arginine kinase activator n=1 Tax=Metabacillus malikii TaxID=1504265 RepID=A0ABT9ZL68_9BACI|nr:protein arginine kinase activator [Metabacillus malikii]